MTHTIDPVQQHFAQAKAGLEQLRRQLSASQQQDELRRLLDDVQENVEQAVWQASLRQRVTPGSVSATPYCRALPLGPHHSKHFEERRHGMLAADRSLLSTGGAAPWDALLYGRYQIKDGLARQSYECGFVMRLYQLLQEANAERPTGR